MGLGSYFELCHIFQRFPNSACQHCGKCNLLSEYSGTLPPLRRTSYSTYPPSCALSPHGLITVMPRRVCLFQFVLQIPSVLFNRQRIITNTTINSVVKALALQYRQSKTGFLLLAWSENDKSQHYKMNYPYQVMVALNRETSFIVLAISLFYLSMFATTSPPSLFSRCKYRYNFSYYQTFDAILIHFN